MKRSFQAFACAITLSAATCAAAQPAQVIIEGTRYDQRRDDTASTIVVGRDELLAHGDRSVAEVLARVPGITIRAGQDGTSAIRMRGLGNGYTQILLNGVAAPAGFALESLAPELIEKIEIVRSASAELGVQAIAGTVNIVLRKSVARSGRSGKFALDAQGGEPSSSFSGEVSAKRERLSYTVAATAGRTRMLASSVDLEYQGALARETTRRELNIIDTASITPRLNLHLDDGATLSLHGLASINRRRAAGENHETFALLPSAIAHSAVTLIPRASFVQAALSWERQLASGVRAQIDMGVHDSHRRSEFAFAGSAPSAEIHTVAVRIREGGWQGGGKMRTMLPGRHELVLGWEAAHSRRDQTRAGNDTGNPADTRLERYRGVIDRAAAYVQDDWQVDGAWSLSLGLRAEALKTTAGEARTAPVQLSTRILSPILQVLYKPDRARQLRAGVSRTYKAPTMLALMPRRYVVDNNNNETNPDTQGNPALRAETAWGLDAGFDHYFGRDGGKQAMLGVSTFVRSIDDAIVRRLEHDALGWVARQSNGGRALASGWLIEGRAPLVMLWPGWPSIDARFSLARNHSRVRAPGVRATRLDGQEPVSASMGLDYRFSRANMRRLTLGASMTYKKGGMIDWSDTVSSSSTAVRALDLYATWEHAGGMRLRLGVVNLLRRDDRHVLRAGSRMTSVTSKENIGLKFALELVSKR